MRLNIIEIAAEAEEEAIFEKSLVKFQEKLNTASLKSNRKL